MLAKRGAPPELLLGTAGLEMVQISVLILVMLGSAHSQLLVGVSVAPLGCGINVAKLCCYSS